MKDLRKRFWPSLKIIARILEVLRDSGAVTKTDLSQKAGINYTRLRKHLDWLEEKGIVELKVQSHKIIVDLTKTGRELAAIVLHNGKR